MLSEPNRLPVKSPFRDGTVTCADENHAIAAFREMVFDQKQNVMN